MYFSLKGPIIHLNEDFLVVEVQGVGYQAFCSAKTLSQVAVGEVVQLYTYTHVREDILALFGFSTLAERQLFLQLTTVSGVGPKVGLALLSALNPDEVASAIASQDPTPFTRASGVGKKLAERIVLELKGKMLAPATLGATPAARTLTGVGQDVISALQNMGFKPAEAQAALSLAQKGLGAGAEFGPLLKESLKSLRK